MKLETVDVIGGGPGGLFAARLLKRRFPDTRIVVHEQRDLGQTFGFGIGLAPDTQRKIAAADPECAAALHEIAHSGAGAVLRLPTGEARMPADGNIGIERLALLRQLTRLAVESGVEIRYGERAVWSELDADLVIAADGVNSAVRHDLRDTVGAHVETGRGRYLWCGADFALPDAVFEPVETEHGVFTIHAYPYSDHRSTFLVETDDDTWHRAGFDESTARTPEHESDEESLRFLSTVFADALGGRQLIGNRTRWRRFETVSCERWWSGNIALVGDAAHTAHYSIGSGTKLAMEDAIALASSVASGDTVQDALIAYDQARRPRVESLQEAARRSQSWWDSFPSRLHLAPETVLASYMTRTGRVDLERLDGVAPHVVRGALRAFAPDSPLIGEDDAIVRWVMNRPFTKGRLSTAGRIVTSDDLAQHSITRVLIDRGSAWSTEADVLLTELAGHSLGLDVVLLSGPSGDNMLGARLDFAERVALAYPRAIVVVENEVPSAPALVAGLVAGRLDLVAASSPPAPSDLAMSGLSEVATA